MLTIFSSKLYLNEMQHYFQFTDKTQIFPNFLMDAKY